MIDYSGKAALVTGAASGIGLALSKALAARGAKVIMADVDAERLKHAKTELGAAATARPCDLAAPGAPEELVADAFRVHGRLDVVCSNAGMGRSHRLAKETLDDGVTRLFAVNLFAALRILQSYLKQLEGNGGRGRLIITASENALSVPTAVKRSGLGLYAATKHGVLILAEWMRSELSSAPIDVHVLLPGAVYTPMIARALPDPAKVPPELGLIMPERCAEIALRGMDLGLFYIPTHAHLIDDMKPRYEGVAEATKLLEL